ncbi:EsaB/YukD family protein [Actinoallomurus soli]|uniref:EsaB/YukD family protein n=1 Tax=Actinoallomurus soli TaxID=2952535 RepID=UPI002092D80A|nr:EsaB/YukD family protein [Actinoallomurus soli]MCO5971377.1 EsaB/YukD family protein [Actinoallomurus soli]
MRRDLSAITVRVSGQRVDLTLPNTVPLLELTPAVAELCGIDSEDARPAAWSLARVGRTPFPLTATLAEQAVLDGEVLHLVDVSAWDSPRVVAFDDPVTTAAADGAERPASALAGPVAATFAAGLLGIGAAVAAVLPKVRTTAGPALLATVAALLTVAYLLRRDGERRGPRLGLVWGTWAMAPVAGYGLTGGIPHAGPVGGALALLASVLAAGPLAPEAVPGMALFAGVLTAASAAVAAGARPSQAAAAAAVAVTIALRVGPALLSARLSRRAALAPGDVEALARRSRGLLVSGTYGCTAAVAVAAVVMAASGNLFAVALTAVTAASLAVRAATFRYAREALPVAVGSGLAGLAAMAGLARILASYGWGGAAVIAATAAGTGLALLGAVPRRRTGGRRRTATWWTLIDGATAPLALAAMGVLGGIAGLVGGVLN